MIGDVEPRGLCGSGLVDAVAELVRVGLLDASPAASSPTRSPRRSRPALADRLTDDRPGAGLRAAPADAATPTPTSASCSPSATCASCSSPRPRSRPAGRCCSRSSASSTATSSRCCSPGSFGSYLSAASAVRIGLVPKLPVLRIVAAGNVAGEGAKMALLSVRERAGRPGAARGGDLCRALRPHRLQRPVRRPARLPRADERPDGRALDRLRRDRPAGVPRSSRGAAGRSTSTRCRRCCTTSPHLIAGEVAPAGRPSCARRTTRVAVGYADCGTYGALDEVCDELGLRRLPGPALLRRVRRASRDLRAVLRRAAGHLPAHRLPGPVVRPHRRSASSASTASPSCATTYFRHYTRVVWLAQEPDAELRTARRRGPPTRSACRSTVVETGDGRLEDALADAGRGRTDLGRPTARRIGHD